MSPATAAYLKSLPKPGDSEGWNARMEAMFQQVLGTIQTPVTPEPESNDE